LTEGSERSRPRKSPDKSGAEVPSQEELGKKVMVDLFKEQRSRPRAEVPSQEEPGKKVMVDLLSEEA
jgi:hypothetical protein